VKAQQLRPRAAWLTALLFATLVLSVAWLVQRADWVDGMPSLALLVVIGLSVWLLLDGLGLSGWKVHTAGLVFGALVVWVFALWLPGGSINSEFSYWASGLTNGEERGGEVVFGVFFLTLFWLLSFEGAWLTFKHGQPWPIIVVGGIVLAVSMVFLPASFRFHVIPFIVGSLFLLLHLSVLHRLQDWTSRMLRHGERTLLSHYGLAFGIGIVAAALVWLLPQMQAAPLKPAARLIQGPVERVERGFQRVFAGLPSRYRSPVLLWDDSTQFAGAQELTDTLLFTVEGESPQYWRARVYDSYSTTGWRSTFNTFVPWEPKDSLGELQSRINVVHTFRVNAATDTLFFGGEPLQFTLPAQALARPEAPVDVLQMRLSEDVLSYFRTRVNLKYAALSSVPVVSEQALEAAGTNYPEWVEDNYLSLPSALPRRVTNLARAVIQDARNPHDAAVAVRNFLLQYPYNLNIQAPPEGRDGVDYFLFDSQEGYCDYYASSMVVMLRSIGVPARYVVGYSPGTWNSTEKVYEVRELNYHSWAEV
jgi:transglutaminase-like putative cysteine protease